MKKIPVLLLGTALLLCLLLTAGCVTGQETKTTSAIVGTWQDPDGEYTYVYMDNNRGYITSDKFYIPIQWEKLDDNTWCDYYFDACILLPNKLVYTHGANAYPYEGQSTLIGGRWTEVGDPDYWMEFHDDGTLKTSDVGVEHDVMWVKGSMPDHYILYYQNLKKTGDNTYLQVSTGRTFTKEGNTLTSEQYKSSSDGEPVFCQMTFNDDGFGTKSEFGVRNNKLYSTSSFAWREVFADGSISYSISCSNKVLQKDGTLRDAASGIILKKISADSPEPSLKTYLHV